MLRNQTLSTQIGFLLVLLLTGVALVPSFHWGWLVAKAVLVVAMLGYVWRVNTRDRTRKQMTVRIEGVGADEQAHFEQRIRAHFGERVTVQPDPQGRGGLLLRINARTTLAALSRRLRRAGLPMSLMGVDGHLTYTAIAGQAKMQVQVEGVASPHSKVYIANLDRPALADARGRFKVAVPFAVVKRHQSRGFIPAIWRKDRISKKIRVMIPA